MYKHLQSLLYSQRQTQTLFFKCKNKDVITYILNIRKYVKGSDCLGVVFTNLKYETNDKELKMHKCKIQTKRFVCLLYITLYTVPQLKEREIVLPTSFSVILCFRNDENWSDISAETPWKLWFTLKFHFHFSINTNYNQAFNHTNPRYSIIYKNYCMLYLV